MKSTSSSTYKKMRALREAQKLGCSGAHLSSDGRWMPCSSHEKLTEVSPVIASSTRDTVSQNRAQRSLKGSNKIKKQWENLGQRGVLNLGSVSGGGIVAGSSTGNFGADMGGISAKATPNPTGPRDKDVDVFADIESARARARQLGCVGVSRRISKTGATVWMPCTNMSDYASLAGTTSLGRRHQKERLERVINQAIEKRLRKQNRPGKKSFDDDVSFKALGGGIGGRLGKPAAFDPNAWDGDNDGRVQDNTPFERPSIPGISGLPIDGLRSRNRPNLNIDEAHQRSAESGDTAFTELTLSKKSKKLAAKYLKSFEETFEPVGDRYRLYSDDEIISLVGNNMATSEEQLKTILRDNPFTKATARTAFKRIMQANPDFEATQTMRDKLLETIRNSPGAIEMVRRYGVPPIIATDYVPAFSWFGNTMETWSLSGGGWSHMGFIAMNPFWSEGAFGYKIEDALRHEMAHSWEAMAATQDDRAREHYALQFAEMYESLFQIARDKTSEQKGELGYQDAAWGTQEEHDSAAKISEYATVARMEWLAESITALSSANANKRSSVDYVAKENISEAFGIPLWEVEQIFTPVDSFGGFRSQFNYLPKSRNGDDGRNSLSSFLRDRYGENDELNAMSAQWLQSNPEYMNEMPLSVQLSSSPELQDRFKKSVTEGFRSYNSTATVGSGGREMGRKIIDRVDPEEANQDEPVLYFVGGTTGSGKSTLVSRGFLQGVPNSSSSAHIDPDEIKTGLVGWDGGRGASRVHQASRVATDRIMEDASSRRMHMVVQGTGKRREHLINMKRKGYKTSGHFVWVPDSLADSRIEERKRKGGANIPTYFGTQIAGELRSGPDAVSRQITDGLYDEFFLYDNSGGSPRIAAQRLSDGSFEIFDDKVFNSFFGTTGGKFVRDYWKDNAGGMRSRSTNKPNAGMRSRSGKERSITRDYTVGGLVFRGFTPREPLNSRDIQGQDLRLADLAGVHIDPRIDFRNRNANYINLSRAHANAVNFAQSSLFGANLSNMNGMGAIFGSAPGRGSDLRYSVLSAGQFVGSMFDGSDLSGAFGVSTNFKNAKLRNVDFTDAVFWDADFRGADLRGSNITAEQLMSSRFDRTTKLPEGLSLPIEEQTIVRSPKPLLHRIPLTVGGGDDADIVGAYLRNGNLVISGPIDRDSLELRRRDLSNSQLSNTSMSQSTLDESSFHGSTFENVDLVGSSLFGCNFGKSELNSVKFDKASLVRANFKNAKIGRNVSFKGALLLDADFRGARFLGKVDLRGANLTGAILNGVDLRDAIVDEKTRISGAIGVDKNKLPPKLRNGFSSRRISTLSDEEIMSIPGHQLLGRANDAYMQIGSIKKSSKSNDDIDSLVSDIKRIYDHFNDVPGINDELSSQNSEIASLIGDTKRSIDELGAFALPNESVLDIRPFIKNKDRSGFVKAVRSADPTTSRKQIAETWQNIQSQLLKLSTLQEQRESLSYTANTVRNKLSGSVATEAMLSDYGVMNNIDNLPDFSLAEPIRQSKPRPSVAAGTMGPREMANYNTRNTPFISQIPKSQRVEQAIKRVDGMASRTRPKSEQGRANRSEEIYKSVSDAIIGALEQADDGKWERPWNLGASIPRNALTKKQYNGFNIILFALVGQARGYEHPIWATYKQWEQLGAQVQRGEKGLTGIKWVAREREVDLPDGSSETSSFMVPRAFTVFNIAQVSGASADDFMPPRLSPEERLPALEDIFKEILPEIRSGNTESAHYNPKDDYINMPPFGSFKDAMGYYATLAHETIHWTGHPDRMNRQNMNKFGTPEYAFEELVAELGSAYLMGIFGMEAEPQEQHAQYIKSWIKMLKDDPSAIQRAAAQAQKAVDFLVEKSPRLKELITPIQESQDIVEED